LDLIIVTIFATLDNKYEYCSKMSIKHHQFSTLVPDIRFRSLMTSLTISVCQNCYEVSLLSTAESLRAWTFQYTVTWLCEETFHRCV